jgi:hypothetical protein
MKSCRIDAYYVKRDQPYTRYKDFFSLHVYNEFTQQGPNIWKGHWNKCTITVIQQHPMSEIKESDVTIERDSDYKEDLDTSYGMPSRKEIALALDKHLNEIYD